MRLTIIATVLIVAAAPAYAASCPASAAKAHVVEHVTWRRTPSPSDLGKIYPERTEFRDEGGVRTDCILDSEGRLRDCRVTTSATPTLDATALKAMAFFLMDMRASRAHAGEHVVVPITFKLGD